MKLLCTLMLVGSLLVTDDQSEMVDEFRRFYAKGKTPHERFEAVQVLKGIDTLAAAQALSAALDDEDFSVRRAAIEVMSAYKREDTAHFLIDDVLMSHKQAKKARMRAGAAEVVGAMGFSFAYFPLSTLLKESDPDLKLSGVIALGHLKDSQACPALVEVVNGPDPGLSVAALDALSSIGNGPGAEPAVLAGLQNGDWRVRARAIQAVQELRLKAGIRPLIGRLDKEEGRLAGDALDVLKLLTLRDLGDTAAPWLAWWDKNEADFVMPPPQSNVTLKAVKSGLGTKYEAVYKRKDFLGVQTRSENILFVIDVSGSMETPFGNPDRLKASGREYSSLQRLAIVKEELTHTIQDLPETTNFNVIAFATDVKSWKKDSARANILNKSSACDWVGKLRPLGGEAANFRAQAGLSTAAASEGQTNTWLALMTALGEPPAGNASHSFVLNNPKAALDTIFFLTDGEPTVGKSVDMREIREEVHRVNAFRGVHIHVIYVGEFGGEEFEKLARENGGEFVAIGG